MATPPFNVATTLPGNTDVVSAYPAVERTFRDIADTWLNMLSDRYGHLQITPLTEAARDADVNFSLASVIYNSDRKVLQICNSAPAGWYTLTIPTGTRAVFQQTAAPLGWTKETNATYNAAALRFVTGDVGTGGSVAFTDALKSWTISQANLPNYNLNVTVNDPGHAHGYKRANQIGVVPGGGSGGGLTAAVDDSTSANYTGISVSVNSGGSGTAMNMAVKYADCIIAVRD